MHFPPILLLNTTDETMKEFYDIDETKDDESLKRHNSSDSGVDLHFPETIILPPKKMTKVSLKMKAAVYSMQIPITSDKSKPYFLMPRSSIGKTPLRLANSVGIIDAQYRGELCVQLDNISDEPYEIKRGQRLFQICSQDLEPFASVRFVSELSETKRGANGFGSTGNN